ncbi:MAG: UMP kinase, partial [Ardenticatenia bacterium]|nr:UMP kinase [Ardenticatenia bacterium]
CRFDQMDYIDALNLGVKVLDSTALSLCMDNHMPIIVLDLWENDSVQRAVLGETIGTIIGP